MSKPSLRCPDVTMSRFETDLIEICATCFRHVPRLHQAARHCALQVPRLQCSPERRAHQAEGVTDCGQRAEDIFSISKLSRALRLRPRRAAQGSGACPRLFCALLGRFPSRSTAAAGWPRAKTNGQGMVRNIKSERYGQGIVKKIKSNEWAGKKT